MRQGLLNCNVYLPELICMGGEGKRDCGWRKNKETEKINSPLFDPSAQSQVLTLEPYREEPFASTKGNIFKGHL